MLKGILLSVTLEAMVNVSFPPSEPSVREMFEPATNFPFKKPAVVSLELTATLTSVSWTIATQAEPEYVDAKTLGIAISQRIRI